MSFNGRFFVVTSYSMFCVAIPVNLDSSPTIMKMAIRETGKHPECPVGGALVGKFHVAITAQGVIRYSLKRHQRSRQESSPLPRIEQVKKSLWGKKTWPPVGLFLSRASADDCLDRAAQASVFDPKWYQQTRATLMEIGLDHPLVSVSTEGALTVPQFLYDKSKLLPD